MTERIERLKGTVEELERELRELETLEPASREVLERALLDIQAALANDAAARLTSGTVTQRFQNAAREFESSHPTLSGVLERVIDALGQWGI